MASKEQVRICVIENKEIYKISSIYLGRDGSFSADVPYCKHESGIIIKSKTKYKSIETVKREDRVEFQTKNRPKLSIHASGFVQFSGKGITSGFDEITGKIKGLGLMSHPLTKPVWSGPTFGINCWGLDLGFRKISSIPKGAIVYNLDDVREKNPVAKMLNTIIIEGWVFSLDQHPEIGIIKSSIGEFVKFKHPTFGDIGMAIIRLNEINSVIGIAPGITFSFFPKDYLYGYMLSSPGEKIKDEKDAWYVMHAICPIGLQKKNSPSLDYETKA